MATEKPREKPAAPAGRIALKVGRRAGAPKPPSVAGLVWPPLEAGPAKAVFAGLVRRLDDTQWWPAERLQAAQLQQLAVLLHHAARVVPFYGERLAAAGYRPGLRLTPERWSRLPVLRRQEVQAAGDTLQAAQIPPGHGRTATVRTSGSTGMPISVTKTGIATLFWHAMVLRDHLWHGRDFSGRFAAIRAMEDGVGLNPRGVRSRSWGKMTAFLHPTGPAFGLSIVASTEQQAAWLQRVQPDYLLCYPSALAALADHCRREGIALPSLKGLLTFGEVCSDDTREACREAWNLGIADSYSSQEVGYIALQCPAHERHYHVMGEDALVEVLDDAGRACRPGETGRVIVTPLHNFATPLIRYAIGDLAEVGPPCPCGRGLLTLTRVGGRTRHMLQLPGGGTLWPRMRAGTYRAIAPIRQFQLAQVALDRLEVRLVVERPLTGEEEDRLRAEILERLGSRQFDVGFSYRDDIPRSDGGKYEDVRCELPAAGS
jgi:phenylacetate-CoA ligase